MNYCKTMITFFYTLNTELPYDPTTPHLSPKTPENGDSDIYVTKFPVALFIKGKNSPSCPPANGGVKETCYPRRLQHYSTKRMNSDPRSGKQMKLENSMLMEKKQIKNTYYITGFIQNIDHKQRYRQKDECLTGWAE